MQNEEGENLSQISLAIWFLSPPRAPSLRSSSQFGARVSINPGEMLPLLDPLKTDQGHLASNLSASAELPFPHLYLSGSQWSCHSGRDAESAGLRAQGSNVPHSKLKPEQDKFLSPCKTPFPPLAASVVPQAPGQSLPQYHSNTATMALLTCEIT